MVTEGKFEEAEKFYLEELSNRYLWTNFTWQPFPRKQCLGVDHVQVAFTMTHLGDLYCQMGKSKEAESNYLGVFSRQFFLNLSGIFNLQKEIESVGKFCDR